MRWVVTPRCEEVSHRGVMGGHIPMCCVVAPRCDLLLHRGVMSARGRAYHPVTAASIRRHMGFRLSSAHGVSHLRSNQFPVPQKTFLKFMLALKRGMWYLTNCKAD